VTAPFLPIPHNWVTQPEHTRRWPAAVLTSRDGSVQSVSQSVLPRETLRYTLSTITIEQAQALTAPVLAAAGATTSATRGQVRVPRWEDAVVLSAAAGSGDTVLACALPSADDLGYRRFANNGEIALWIPNSVSAVLRTLAAVGAVGVSTLTLAAAIGSTFPAGTRIAPVSLARLTEPLEWSRDTGTIGTATLVLDLDTALAGAVVIAPGSPGRAQSPTVATITLTRSQGNLYFGWQVQLRAICKDASGVVIPSPGPLTWTQSTPRFVLRVPDPTSGFAFVEAAGLGGSGAAVTFTATDPISSVSGVISLSPELGA
jgi:hypothetical protein